MFQPVAKRPVAMRACFRPFERMRRCRVNGFRQGDKLAAYSARRLREMEHCARCAIERVG